MQKHLPMSPSQVWIHSPVRCPDSLPFSFLVNEGIVLGLVDTAQGGWRVLLEVHGKHCAERCSNPSCLVMLQSTYCATMVQHCEALNRSVQVVNLDPAAEHFSYSVMAGKS